MSLSHFKLIRKNAWRKRARSLLLVTSIAIAFFLYAALASFEFSFRGGDINSERLIVASKTGNGQTLPYSLINRLSQVPGVETTTYLSRLRVTYKEPYNYIGINAVEPDSYARFFHDEYQIDASMLAALAEVRNGAIVGADLAARESWKSGDRVTFTSQGFRTVNGTSDWTFEIVGIFEGLKSASDTNFIIARYDFVNANRAAERDTVNYFGVLPKPNARPDAVIQAIDSTFANSADETRTRTEVDFMRAFVAQFADVSTIVRLVSSAAFFTILMIVANTMFFAIRERTREIAVMKVLGFSRSFVLTSVLVETVTLFMVGLAIGILLAIAAVTFLRGPLGSVVPGLTLTPFIAMKALGFALLFALITGLIPAIHAMRLSVLSALKGR